MTRREFLAAGGLALAGRALLPPRPPGDVVAGDEVEVSMRSAGRGARVWFEPAGVLVRPGTTVRWIVREGVHTATAYHPLHGGRPRRIPGGARPWDSGYLTAPGDSYGVTLRTEGVHDYFCRPHEAAGMVGRVVVSARRDPDLDAPRFRPAADGTELPRAVRGAFPPVEAIVREGRVDRAGPRTGPGG